MLLSVVSQHGFSVRYVPDVPRSARSVTDLRNRRIYLRQESLGMHTPRAVLLQTLGPLRARPRRRRPTSPSSCASGSRPTTSRPRCWCPSRARPRFLTEAKAARDLSVEDLRDVFSVSYEMAAHRFTNLATHHLGVPCHFVKNDAAGVIYKAYENDGVLFPADAAGAIEGQRMCRFWSGRQVFSAAGQAQPVLPVLRHAVGHLLVHGAGRPGRAGFAITLGVPFEDSRWFRGRETTRRTASACPDGDCCQRPPAALAARWDGQAWPSARAHSHILLALPAGSFPGVDEADVFEFLERHEKDD